MYTFKHPVSSIQLFLFASTVHNLIFGLFKARGRGRGRSRNEDEEEGAGGRPSGPSTLFDFLESKMGVFSINGGYNGLDFILTCLGGTFGP